jgi:hypothetical protein
MFEKGKLIPNIEVMDQRGVRHALWDYRQKTHVALIVDASLSADGRAALATGAAERQKTWEWLGVRVLVAGSAPDGVADGVYAIDRYGELWDILPLGDGLWERLEKSYMYYEACNC